MSWRKGRILEESCLCTCRLDDFEAGAPSSFARPRGLTPLASSPLPSATPHVAFWCFLFAPLFPLSPRRALLRCVLSLPPASVI